MMEPGKHSNSDISSPENDQRPEDNTGIGRSYECTFCKHGFTNAQALGGHMNIHRKDKAYKSNKIKLMHKNNQQGSSEIHHNNVTLSNEKYPNIRYCFQTYNHHHQQQTNNDKPVDYKVYLPAPSKPSFDYESDDFVDVNMSLGFGSVNREEDKVDLELRLGHER